MNRSLIFSLTILSLTLSRVSPSLAIVNFADKRIKKDVERISKKYELVRDLYSKLDSSNFTYTIRYRNIDGHAEGRFETDGEELYLSFRPRAQYSLQARFAHEATHALQFEQGKIAFFKTRRGEWMATNIDVWDEAEAFQSMITVATATDFNNRSRMNKRTKLYEFKRAIEDNGFDNAVKLIENLYPTLNKLPQNNPSFGTETVKGAKYYYNPYSMQ